LTFEAYLKRKQNKGKNAEHKLQTENAVDWKCLFATVIVEFNNCKYLFYRL
jgi:hypothetical protein